MCSDVGLLIGRMRQELREALPPRAFLRRDRGEYLFVSNAPTLTGELPALPGFIWELRGPLLAILPDGSWARELEICSEPPDQLSQSLMRFRGMEAGRAGLGLLARGWKLADAAATGTGTGAEREDYERGLRRRAALALRGGCDGGGLYAGALLNAWLCSHKPYKLYNPNQGG